MFLTKKFNPGLVLILLCILLSACGLSSEELAATSSAETAAAASPTPLPSSTPTSTPTLTPTPLPSETPQPSLTPTPAPEIINGPKLPYYMVWPAYSPEEMWEGIPIHPDTVKGQEYMGGYIYSSYQTVMVLKEYYLSTLGEKGWYLSKIGEAEDGSSQLIFQNEVDELSITIINFGVEFKSGLGVLPPRSVFIEK